MKLNIQYFADGKVVIETDLDDKGFSKGLSKMESLAKTGFKAIATAVGAVSTAMVGALANGVKFNSQIEQLQTSFEVMTGSADKANEIIQKLKKVGASTPYELKGLAKTTQLLMQYGFTADDAYDATINLGDIAQGSAEKMESIALAFGQMSSLGKVTMQDIKQMINAGFNPLQAIADMTGETMQEVNKRYEEGAISVEEVTKAMQYASSEGGKFYKSMEKQSKTLAGQISTLKDNFDSLTGTLAQGLSRTISGDVLPSLNELLTKLEEAFNEGGIPALAETLGQGIADMATSIAKEAPKFINTAFTIINGLITGIQSNLPAITSAAATVATTLANGLLDNLPTIVQTGLDLALGLIDGFSDNADTLIPKAVDTTVELMQKISSDENMDKLVKTGVKLIKALVKGIVSALFDVEHGGKNALERLSVVLSGGQSLLRSLGIKLVQALARGMLEWIGSSKFGEKVLEIKQKIVNWFEKYKESLKQTGINLILGLWQGMKEELSNVKTKLSNALKEMVDTAKKTLKIKSPSRVFRDEVGAMMAAGIGVGFEDEINDVYRDMQNAIDFNTDKMSANVQTNGTYQMAMAGLPEFNLLDNTENTTQLVVNGKVLAEVVNTENKYREVAKA